MDLAPSKPLVDLRFKNGKLTGLTGVHCELYSDRFQRSCAEGAGRSRGRPAPSGDQ